MVMKYMILLFVAVFVTIAHGRSVSAEPQPLSKKMSLPSLLQKAKLHFPELEGDEIKPSSKRYLTVAAKKVIVRPLQIAATRIINQSINSIGQWDRVKGQWVWRLYIEAKDAVHLNLGFKNVFLPKSATLFILKPSSREVLKRYTAQDNKAHGELWTPLFPSNALLIELNVDLTDRAKVRLELLQAGQGYQAVNTKALNKISGSCNIDAVCPEGDQWSDQIRSVARYTISDSKGTYACSGTLLNNTSGDQRPLFLTAAHCIVSETTTSSMVFYWNYLTSECGGTPDGVLTQTQTGARFISRWEGVENNHSDFALVSLDSIPDSNFNVYFSGWDNRDQATTGAITIHHPQGEEKSISLDNDAQTITDFSGSSEDMDARFLRITAWDVGTTELGSSGAGLWNLQGSLIGTLSGGLASCTAITESDWYGRMAKHWLGNHLTSNQLATFLAPGIDPLVSAETALEGVTHCSNPVVAINVSTITPGIGESVSFFSTVSGGTGDYAYQWDFDDDGLVDSMAANPVYIFSFASNNRVKLVVTDADQCPGIGTINVLAAEPTEAFLGDGMLPSVFRQIILTEGSWMVDDGQSSEGLFSLRSQIVNGDQSSSIEINGLFLAGDISFDRRVSSEDTLDFFKFYIDDAEMFSISGEQDWSNISYPISAGEHTFRWSFEKDPAVSDGQDAGWIDDLKLPEAINRDPLVVVDIAEQNFIHIDSVNLDIKENFIDPDNDPLFYTMLGAPSSLSMVNGVISGVLNTTDVGNSPYTVTVSANDTLASVSSRFMINIVLTAAPPVIANTPANQVNTEGDTIQLDLSAIFTDPNNDPLSYTMEDGPTSLSMNINTAVISGRLTASDSISSPYTVSVAASDGVFSVSTSFTWTVKAKPTPPAVSSGGGSFDYLLIGLLFLSLRLHQRKK